MNAVLRAVGPSAWLVELDPDRVVAFAAAARTAAPTGVLEVVPAARTVLVMFGIDADRRELGRWLSELAIPSQNDPDVDRPTVEIPVTYDGADLAEVASATGMSTAEVIERHTGVTYRSAFCGFAPGFAYLTGLDAALHLPRRSTPRTRVPAGAVAIAATYSAVYPTASPGGWHLLGHTPLAVWDLDRDPPARLAPGTTVHFVAV